MIKKQRKYSSDFKTKVVLELLSGDETLGQLCSRYSLVSKTVLNWKKVFLSNASLAFNIDGAVSEYKEEIDLQRKEVNELHRQLGKRTAELGWATKKLKSLGSESKKEMLDSKLDRVTISRQCELVNFNRSSYYYEPKDISANKLSLLRAIDYHYTQIPFYGYRKLHKQLIESGHSIGINRVRDYMNELGLKAIYPGKKINTSLANLEHKKYPYLLRAIKISRANQVWGTDITYVRLDGGFVYLAAIIDWHSKAILSYKISNTMD